MKRFYFQLKSVWETHVPTIHTTMMMKKGSQFKRFFTQEMKKLETTGNLDLLRKRYWDSQVCKPLLKEKPLGFEKLSSLFVLIMIGSILSILVLLLEYVNQRKKKKQEITAKVVQIIHEYINGFSLSKMEIENILKNLYQKHHIKKH